MVGNNKSPFLMVMTPVGFGRDDPVQTGRRRQARHYAFHHLCGHGRDHDRLAARAAALAADVALHEELWRHAVQLLADFLANALEGLTASQRRLFDLVAMVDARQLFGQRPAHRLAALGA